jgi:hypothetical protein
MAHAHEVRGWDITLSCELDLAAQKLRATGKQVSLVEVELSNIENVLALINPEEPPRTQLHFNVVDPYSFTEREREIRCCHT